MQDKTNFRLDNLEKKTEKLESKQEMIEKVQVEIHERLKSTEAVTEKLSDLVDEIRISNVTISNFVERTKEKEKILYTAIITSSIGIIASLLSLMLTK